MTKDVSATRPRVKSAVRLSLVYLALPIPPHAFGAGPNWIVSASYATTGRPARTGGS